MKWRYGRPLQFGLSIVPASAEIELARIFWPEEEPLHQLERFAEEVVPALRR